MKKTIFKIWKASAMITVGGLIAGAGYISGAIQMKNYLNNKNV